MEDSGRIIALAAAPRRPFSKTTKNQNQNQKTNDQNHKMFDEFHMSLHVSN
jgi:hypothetical protein